MRGLYYDQWEPEKQPEKTRSLDAFLKPVGEQLENIRPVNVQEGTRAVFQVLSHHLDRGQTRKVHDALPEEIRRSLWPDQFFEGAPSRQNSTRTGGCRAGSAAALSLALQSLHAATNGTYHEPECMS